MRSDYSEAIFDLRVESRFKNAVLYRILHETFGAEAARRKHHGVAPVLKVASEATGVPVHTIRALLNLTSTPYRKKYSRKEISEGARRLAQVTGMSIEELFPRSLYELLLPRVVVREYQSPQILTLAEAQREGYSLAAPDTTAIDQGELQRDVTQALEVIGGQQAFVLRRLFGLDGADEDDLAGVAARINRSRVRVAQIRDRALRRLRHPSMKKLLGPHVDPTHRTLAQIYADYVAHEEAFRSA